MKLEMAAGSLWRFAYLHAIWPPAFVKAEDAVPQTARTAKPLATRFIHLISRLFGAEACSAKWPANRLKRLRRRCNVNVLAIIEQMFVHLSAVVPGSMLGKALQYLNGQ